MAKLFSKSAAVTTIPGEKDVDPELLENNPKEGAGGAGGPGQGTGADHDFRDSNSGDRFGTRQASAPEWQSTAIRGDKLVIAFDRRPTAPEFEAWAAESKLTPKTAKIVGRNVEVVLARDKSFVSQHREDGSYVIEEVEDSKAEETAQALTDAPDAQKAHVIHAPDAEAARGEVYKKMKDEGVEPAATDKVFTPTASWVVKSGSLYFTKEGRVVASRDAAELHDTRDAAETAASKTATGRVVKVAAESKLAWSNALKKEVQTRCAKSPTFAALTPEQVDEFLTHTERLVPVEGAKNFILYLALQHFNVNPPAWMPGEDDAVIRPLMHNFEKLCVTGKLQADAKNIFNYKALDQLKKTVGDLMDKDNATEPEVEVSDEEEAGKSRFDVHRKKYLPADLQAIAAGSTVIAEVNGYAVYKIKDHPDQAGKDAAQLLCNNGINKVSWCVGRGTLSYLDQGPFYVLVKGGRSRFAISTKLQGNEATIWNPADTPVWVTTSGGAAGFQNLQQAANAKGLTLDMSQISSLPADIIDVLAAARQADPQLMAMIPETHLVKGDTGPLDKAIMACPIQGLVSDLAEGFQSERTMGLASAVMGRAIALHYDFSPEYSMFNENLLVAYIELLAAAGEGLPKSLEDAIIQAIQSTM